jgi:DNA-binding SARP family transcriptional activator
MFEFRVLGPVELRVDGTPVPLDALKPRTMLVALVVKPNQVVGRDRLIEALWQSRPPASAAANLRTYAARLRRALADRDSPSGSRMVTHEDGYVLSLGTADELDLVTFESLTARGRAALAAGEPVRAVRLLERAVALWRDDRAATGIPRYGTLGIWLDTVDEQRLAAHEYLTEARLALGEHHDLVPVLRRAAAEQPLRERSWELLMLALYRAGDVAAALASYARASAVLREQLGVDPGPDLRRLHRAILTRDDALAVPATAIYGGPSTDIAAVPGTPTAAVPRELPPGPKLYGRAAEYEQLLTAVDQPRGVPVTVALHGPVGSGKSALAVAVAHEVAGRFPDGQLYVDLAGRSAPDPPGTADVLARLLAALDAPVDGRYPVDALSARFRSVLAGQRLLLVLDNADRAAQVSPLLPAGAGCAVLVTSRRYLAALDTVATVRVGALPAGAAVALLARYVDPQRLRAEPAGVAALVEACGGLPLALRIVAGRLAARPLLGVAWLARYLRTSRRPLDMLAVDELSVRGRLEEQHSALGPAAARAFAVLGRTGRREATPRTLAEALGTSVEQVGTVLDELADAQLIEPAPGDRYLLPPLPRMLAAELAEESRDGSVPVHLVRTAAGG